MKKLILSTLIIFFSITAFGQLEKYKAIFMYKFAQNFEWPANKITNSYKIGVLGNNAMYDELTKLIDGRSINGKPIQVIRYAYGDSQTDLCMLFISKDDKDSFDVLKSDATKNSVVIVGESAGLAKRGAPVNFVNSGGALKFELNESSLNACNVKASGSIKSLAILVN